MPPIQNFSSSFRSLALALTMAVTGLVAVPQPGHAAPGDKLPEAKQTRSGLYLEASGVPAFVAQQGGPGNVLFLDVRSRAEAMFVGMAANVDAQVPFVDLQELMTDWDAQRNAYRLEPLQDFVPAVERRLKAKSLSKADVVILICRSGDRSSRAANRLAEDGYTRVYSVVDGFEGDLSPDGRRTVNGWKNAGLPWSYRLEKTKMYFPQ